ncbi:MAG TPA: hypothetical protein VGL44_06905 [Gaiellales bacterium]
MWAPADIVSAVSLVAAPIAATLFAWRLGSRTGRVAVGLGGGLLAGCVLIAVAVAQPSPGPGADGLEGLADILAGGLDLALVLAGSAFGSAWAVSSAALRAQERLGQ